MASSVGRGQLLLGLAVDVVDLVTVALLLLAVLPLQGGQGQQQSGHEGLVDQGAHGCCAAMQRA